MAIPGRIRQIGDHVLKQFFGGFETERGRVADIQLDYPVAFVFQAVRFTQHGAANVVTYAFEFVGFADVVLIACHEVPAGRLVEGREVILQCVLFTVYLTPAYKRHKPE